MGFIDDISKKISKGTRIIGQKSGEVFEVTKVKLDIASERDKLEKLYEDIGKMVYEIHKEGSMEIPDISDKCRLIDEVQYKIKSLNRKIVQIKGGSLCKKCGEVVSPTQRYCQHCGRELEQVSSVVENKEDYRVEVSNGVVCKECGAFNEKGSEYCSSCGDEM